VAKLNAAGSHPEIVFTAFSGQQVHYPQGGLVWGWRVGDTVPVRYDPANPERDPCVEKVTAIWTAPFGFLFAALVTFGALAAARLGWRVSGG
jgi:hypothetical protein